jgi:signal transduction histidine kinase
MQPQTSAILAGLERAFGSLPPGCAVEEGARERARAAAAEARRLSPDSHEAVAALCFAAEMLGSLPPGAAAEVGAVRGLVDELEAAIPAPRALLGRLALGGPVAGASAGRAADPSAALARNLVLLLAVVRADWISLWSAASGAPLQLARVGAEAGDPAARSVAAALLATDAPAEHAEADAFGVRLTDDRHPAAAALVAGGGPGTAREPLPPGAWRALFEAAAPALLALIDAGEEGEARRAGAAAQRRLTRLRFDLHDGPQQDVILLADDLRMFQEQLEAVLGEHPSRALVAGRLDDLKARLVALDGDLRRISSLLESPFLQTRSFPEALAALTEAFTDRTGIVPETALSGDFGTLSDSQQITLLGLLREALSNIREHSEAAAVTITLVSEAGGVTARVTDDGCGFDPDRELVRAAGEGHLGLVGMHERVRMLGGSTQIESRPGGPTVISASLPARTAGGGEAPRFTVY